MPDAPNEVQQPDDDPGILIAAVQHAMKQPGVPPYVAPIVLGITTMVQDFYDDVRSYLFMKKIESLASTAKHFDDMDEGHFRELFIDEVRTRLAEAGVDIEKAGLALAGEKKAS